MRLFPAPIDIADDGFEKDLFNRREFGERLTNLVLNIDDPMVIVLDSPWGSGKTTFIKMWKTLLKSNGIECIYFDAFENDYCKDAFSTIVGELVSGIGEDKDHKITKDALIRCAGKVALTLLKAGTRVALKKATLGFIDENTVKDFQSEIDTLSSESADTLASFLQDRIKNRDREKYTFREFRDLLKNLPVNIYGSESSKPIVFIIDELDRCRPDFAIEIIECIKHFFSIERIHFILSTHLHQIECSIKMLYGVHDPQKYMEKFYNIKLHLPENRDKFESNAKKYIAHILKDMPGDSEGGNFAEHVIEDIGDLSRIYGLSFRSVERIATNIALCFACTTDKYLRLTPILSVLATMRVVNPQLYQSAKSRTITYQEVVDFAKFDLWTSSRRYDPESPQKWWQFCLLKDPSEEILEFGRYLNRFSAGRNDIVPIICDFMDQLKFVNQ